MKSYHRKLRAYDNGGKTCDRYTIVIGKAVFSMNEYPFHPAFGVCQYCGDITDPQYRSKNYSHWGKLVPIESLPADTQQAIKDRQEN